MGSGAEAIIIDLHIKGWPQVSRLLEQSTAAGGMQPQKEQATNTIYSLQTVSFCIVRSY